MHQRDGKKNRKKVYKSLEDACTDITKDQHEKMRERARIKIQQDKRKEEDEVMALIYGPNWREKELV